MNTENELAPFHFGTREVPFFAFRLKDRWFREPTSDQKSSVNTSADHGEEYYGFLSETSNDPAEELCDFVQPWLEG